MQNLAGDTKGPSREIEGSVNRRFETQEYENATKQHAITSIRDEMEALPNDFKIWMERFPQINEMANINPAQIREISFMSSTIGGESSAAQEVYPNARINFHAVSERNRPPVKSINPNRQGNMTQSNDLLELLDDTEKQTGERPDIIVIDNPYVGPNLKLRHMQKLAYTLADSGILITSAASEIDSALSLFEVLGRKPAFTGEYGEFSIWRKPATQIGSLITPPESLK